MGAVVPLPVGRVNVMDIDNDGRADVIYRRDSFANWQFWRSTGTNTAQLINGTFQSRMSNSVVPVYQGDFNGDGRIDIITWVDDQKFQTCLTDDSTLQLLGTGPADCAEHVQQQPRRLRGLQEQPCQVRDPGGRRRRRRSRRPGSSPRQVRGSQRARRVFATNGRFALLASTAWPATGSAMRDSSRDRRARSTRRSSFDFNGDGLADIVARRKPGAAPWSACRRATAHSSFTIGSCTGRPGAAEVGRSGNRSADQLLHRGERAGTGSATVLSAAPRRSCTATSTAMAAPTSSCGSGRGQPWRVCLSTGTNFALLRLARRPPQIATRIRT